MPIVEPEVDIHCPEKANAEGLLKAAILEKLNQLPQGQMVMLELTLPGAGQLLCRLRQHPKVLRVVALSGGYSRDEANKRLRRNHGVVASFSRALPKDYRLSNPPLSSTRCWTDRFKAFSTHPTLKKSSLKCIRRPP